MTTIELTDTKQTDIDAAAVEEFTLNIIETMTGGLLTTLIDIGRRTRLFEVATCRPGNVCRAR